MMTDCLYADFRIRPKHRCHRQRLFRDLRRDRRQSYVSERLQKKEQDQKLRDAKTLRLGDQHARGQRAWKCRPGCGKHGWLLMNDTLQEEDEKHNVSTDVLNVFVQMQEHCGKRWDAAVRRAEDIARTYPAFDMRVLNIFGSVQYKNPASKALRMYGPVQRLPALHIVWPSPRASDFSSRLVCPICCTQQPALLAGCGSDCHLACCRCWSRWVDGQADRMRMQRCMGSFTCFGAGCHEVIDSRVWEFCPGANKLRDDLDRRSVLQQNVLYPACVQVDCPCPGCVGLGYLGHDTVMCFLCEHQWPADNGTKPSDSIDSLTDTKACPRCSAPIEKNGGCDHMTCRCGYEFWWSTLNAYR